MNTCVLFAIHGTITVHICTGCECVRPTLFLTPAPRSAVRASRSRQVGGHGLEGSLVKNTETKDDPWEPVMGPKCAGAVCHARGIQGPWKPFVGSSKWSASGMIGGKIGMIRMTVPSCPARTTSSEGLRAAPAEGLVARPPTPPTRHRMPVYEVVSAVPDSDFPLGDCSQGCRAARMIG